MGLRAFGLTVTLAVLGAGTAPASADVPGDVVAYVSALTEDSIMRLSDLNGDGDFNDAGEATQFFGPGNADGWPGVGSAQCILVLGYDHLLAADGEESGAFDTRVYRLRDLNGDNDAMDAGEATVFWDALLPIGVNYDRPKEITIGPDGAYYLADNNTINFDYDTPEAVWRLEDLNADGDVNDAGEVTLHVELAPIGSAFGFICEDFTWNSAGELVFSNQESSTNTGMVWIIRPDLSLHQLADDGDILGIGFSKVALTLHPQTENPVMVGFDILENRRILELVDTNGNGVIDDAGETSSLYRSDIAAEPLLWNYQSSGPTDLDYAPDGSLWLLNNVDDLIIRFIDQNGDGDFNDVAEAAEVYRGLEAGANGGFATTFPRTIGFARVPLLGDMNCDGLISAADIDPFVIALTAGPDGYAAAFPNCRYENADINGDGSVSAADIDPFVLILTGG
jgi:hypothetical protein